MDRFSVFCRTEAGDRMMAEPKGSGDRLTRSVLEAVDGFSTVGELVTRLKDGKSVQRALTELERAGLIETLDARMARVAEQEARWLRGDETPARVEPREIAQSSPAAADPAPTAADKRKQTADARRLERALGSGSQASIFDKIRVFFGTLGHRAVSGGGKGGDKIRRGLMIVLALLIVGGLGAAVAALAWQASTLRQRVEQDAANWLGEPVKVGRVGVAFHPWPVFELGDIQIGEGGTSHIDRAFGGPDWFRWVTSQPQRLRVALNGGSLQPSLLARLSGLESPGRVWRLKEVQVDALSVPVGKAVIADLSGAFLFSGDGKWESARLKPKEVAVTYELQVQDGNILASVIAPEFKYGETKLDNVLISGRMGLNGMDDAQFSANWLGGAIKGVVSLDFLSRVAVKGQFKVDALSFDQLAALMDTQSLVSGRVSGPMTLSGEADSLADLASASKWTGNYAIADGSINRIDLVEAMRRSGNAPISGGVTRFNVMEGTVVREPGKGVRLEIRRLDAGALSASGRVQVDTEGVVRGALRSEVKTPVERIVRLFSVEGTLKTMQLRPQGE
ncbi:hypothetical protein [Niveibacterium sp. COAC-50]|uniref:hypothetical protein n=1 Tax=Niveibacterium sp. COAC-50 TaxID=2729384 RepID=UPI0015523FB5|nr:hypothetical protein [Niveibacterium sp. COAC-50]